MLLTSDELFLGVKFRKSGEAELRKERKTKTVPLKPLDFYKTEATDNTLLKHLRYICFNVK